jgi:hypothetical protein
MKSYEMYNFRIIQRTCKKIETILIMNKTGATGGTGTAYPSGAPEFTPGF